MIKAVLFDYGGVLSPGGKDLLHVYAQLLGVPDAKVNIKPFHNELRCGLISTDYFFAKLNQRYGTKVTPQQFVDHSDIYAKELTVYDLAKRLRQHGIKTGILSNMYKMSADKLRAEGYYDGFDPIVLSCDEKLAKPTLEFYQRAVDRVGCRADEIIFIDDQGKCLPPATELGMKVVKDVTPEQVIKEVAEILKRENGLEL